LTFKEKTFLSKLINLALQEKSAPIFIRENKNLANQTKWPLVWYFAIRFKRWKLVEDL